jgi:hypothetical protein
MGSVCISAPAAGWGAIGPRISSRARGILHLAGWDIPVRVRHVTDEAEARGAAMVNRKYETVNTPSAVGEALTPAEQATLN